VRSHTVNPLFFQRIPEMFPPSFFPIRKSRLACAFVFLPPIQYRREPSPQTRNLGPPSPLGPFHYEVQRHFSPLFCKVHILLAKVISLCLSPLLVREDNDFSVFQDSYFLSIKKRVYPFSSLLFLRLRQRTSIETKDNISFRTFSSPISEDWSVRRFLLFDVTCKVSHRDPDVHVTTPLSGLPPLPSPPAR